MEAIEQRVRGAIETLLAALRRDGRLRVDDVATAAFVIHLSAEWTASRLVLGGAPVAIDAAVDAATEMISRYLFDDPGLDRGSCGPARPAGGAGCNRPG
jgi:hypothetical protein